MISNQGHGQHWPNRKRVSEKYDNEWFENHSTWGEVFRDVETGEMFRCSDYKDFPACFDSSFTVYRILAVEDGDVDYSNMGVHWSWEYRNWHPWEGKPIRPQFIPIHDLRPRNLIIVQGEGRKEDIDVSETLFQNLVYQFSEKEIVFQSGTEMRIISVNKLCLNNFYDSLVIGEELPHPEVGTV